MDWIKYPENKPEHDCACYVNNVKAGLECYIALYNSDYDFFKWYNPELYKHPPIEVTHYLVLPCATHDEIIE